jgi:TIR domain
MSYLPKYKNDLFISYRHIVNEDDDKWVDVFCNKLMKRLKVIVSESVEAWKDNEELRAGDVWRQEIDEALESSAIFLAIISRTYLDSKVCRHELDRFIGLTKDAAAAMPHRIVPIFKQPTKADQEIPSRLRGSNHFIFFQEDPPGSKYWRELGPGMDVKRTRQFQEKLERLAQELSDQLETLKDNLRQQAIGKVYLASVGPELNDEREKLRFDLQQRGYLVVPQHDYFWNEDNVREEMAEDLHEAKLCVHLIGRSASDEPETPGRAKLQLELGVEAMRGNAKPLPLVWIQPADQTDATARELIAYVENELSNEGVEYWQGSLEEFKTQIYDKLPKAPAQPAQGAAKSVREIALIVEEGDLAATGEINTLLVANLNVETSRIGFSGTVAKNLPALEKTLARCGRCILFWGAQSEDWVKEILAMDALAGHIGPEQLCVYAAAPQTPEKSTFCTSKARVMLAGPGGGETELRAFLAATERGQG